jgi:hypothetical protein
MSALRTISFLFAAITLMMARGFTQETIHFASLAGSVSDSTGAMITGATVSARQTATNIDKVSITDQQGRFRFAYLPVGNYEVKVHSPGFADISRTLALTVGSAFDISMKLGVNAPDSTVLVVDDLPVLETARSQVASTLSQQEISSVPLNGRSFLDLALLIPGVSPTNTASTQLFPETSAVPGQGVSINSQRNFSNSFVLDGLSANDDAAGLVGTFYSLGAIQEMQAVNSGGQA